MKKKKTGKNNIWLGVIIFVALIIVVYLIAPANWQKLINNRMDNSQNEVDKATTFESKYLEFSVSLPIGFQAIDETSRITINSSNSQISVTRNGTQFKNLDGYIKDFDSKRKLTAKDIENTTINGHESLSREVMFPDQNYTQKSYYIYVNNVVYVLSTNTQALYDDLDQIARSFKYTGD